MLSSFGCRVTRAMGGEAKRLRALRIEPDGAKRRNTYKIAEFIEGDSPAVNVRAQRR